MENKTENVRKVCAAVHIVYRDAHMKNNVYGTAWKTKITQLFSLTP